MVNYKNRGHVYQPQLIETHCHVQNSKESGPAAKQESHQRRGIVLLNSYNTKSFVRCGRNMRMESAKKRSSGGVEASLPKERGMRLLFEDLRRIRIFSLQ